MPARTSYKNDPNFGGGTRGLNCNYGWTMKVQLRFWNVSFLTSMVYVVCQYVDLVTVGVVIAGNC